MVRRGEGVRRRTEGWRRGCRACDFGCFLGGLEVGLSFMAGCEYDLKFNSAASSTPSVVGGIEIWSLN